MKTPTHRLRRIVPLLVLTSGTLLQTTSCSTLVSDAFSGWVSSVTTNLIRREVYSLFNVSSAASLTGASSIGS